MLKKADWNNMEMRKWSKKFFIINILLIYYANIIKDFKVIC